MAVSNPPTAPRPGSFVGAVPSPAYSATATFTPAAAAYLAGDVMDVAKALSLPAGEMLIKSASLQVAHTALIAGEGAYYLALYNVTPPSAHADNDAWDVPAGDRAAFLGRIDLGTPVDLGSTLQMVTIEINLPVTVPVGGLYAELVTANAFTPTAVARKVVLKGVAIG